MIIINWKTDNDFCFTETLTTIISNCKYLTTLYIIIDFTPEQNSTFTDKQFLIRCSELFKKMKKMFDKNAANMHNVFEENNISTNFSINIYYKMFIPYYVRLNALILIY